jgi:membrane protein required for colicin V production
LALTGLDMLVLLTVGLGAVLGFSRGFVSEFISLGAWVLAILAVKLVQPAVSAMLVVPVGTESGAALLGFALVFGVTFLIVKAIGKKLGRSTRGSILGPFDRVLGFAFGALKGLIAATLVFLFVSLIFDMIHGGTAPRPGWMKASRTYPLLRASSTAMVDFVERRRVK